MSMETAAELVLSRAGDDRTAVVFEGQQWTWADVVDAAASRAAWMREQLRPDEPPHVGVLLENTPEYVFLLGGAALASATIVGINPTRRGEELARDIRHTDCQLVLTEASQAHLLDDLDLGGAVVADAGTIDHPEASLPKPTATPDTLYLLLFTSGSTGAPKAVRFSQGRAARAATRVPFRADDVIYSAMPL